MLTPRLPKPKCPDIVIILVRRSRLEKHRSNGLIASASTDGLIASASTEGKAIRRWQGYNYYQQEAAKQEVPKHPLPVENSKNMHHEIQHEHSFEMRCMKAIFEKMAQLPSALGADRKWRKQEVPK